MISHYIVQSKCLILSMVIIIAGFCLLILFLNNSEQPASGSHDCRGCKRRESHTDPFGSVLVAVLQAAGFKPNFCRCISLLYHSPNAVMQVNGKWSHTFVLSWSVCQGCPLLPLLYALVLEPLLHRLSGITIPGRA